MTVVTVVPWWSSIYFTGLYSALLSMNEELIRQEDLYAPSALIILMDINAFLITC